MPSGSPKMAPMPVGSAAAGGWLTPKAEAGTSVQLCFTQSPIWLTGVLPPPPKSTPRPPPLCSRTKCSWPFCTRERKWLRDGWGTEPLNPPIGMTVSPVARM